MPSIIIIMAFCLHAQINRNEIKALNWDIDVNYEYHLRHVQVADDLKRGFNWFSRENVQQTWRRLIHLQSICIFQEIHSYFSSILRKTLQFTRSIIHSRLNRHKNAGRKIYSQDVTKKYKKSDKCSCECINNW